MAKRDTEARRQLVCGVPRPPQKAVGKRELVRALHTTDLAVAQSRRHAVLAELERTITAARGQGHQDAWLAEALRWREGSATSWRDMKIWPDPGPEKRRQAALQKAIL